jgi:uncharacterized protein
MTKTGLGIPVLIVPGIGDSGPMHWQSRWEPRLPHGRRVAQRDWDHPRCAEWTDALEAAVAACPEAPLLVAHSIGCLVVAHWASESTRAVRGAFLVAVPDPQAPAFPAAATGFGQVPLLPLRFPSLVVASTDDAFGSIMHAQRCAEAWGSEFIAIGSAGHINAESGHGEWPQGFSLLEGFRERAMSTSR